MQISKDNAMKIVTEISGIINQHVNMMDERGIIIASTDPERLGTFHAGAAQVVSNKLEELIVQNNSEYEGTRKGINLPIVFQNEVVGVIGITGEREKVVKYGQIIKKMTEILLLDTSAKEQKKIDDRIRARFLDEWVFGDAGNFNQPFIERGIELGIDITVPRRVLVASIIELKNYSDNPEGQRLIDNVNKTVRHMMEQTSGGVFMKTAFQFVCLVPDCPDEQMNRLAEQIARTVYGAFQVRLAIGIDSRAASYSLIHQSYIKAEKALRACVSSSDKKPRFYNDINVELFMGDIPKATKEEFVRRVFRGCTPEEIENWMPLLQAFFDVDGSIGLAAQRLFIHKNTLQYKLKKLHELTGYDPRSLSNAALFTMAIQFYNENRDELLLY
ncbi:carbohydrate diacid regulator [Hydrogenoanaerobacterium saccharovorans]|uniref:Carbohydrate diacid regulator n=1 Tax=Hydrogenoanaerobacterium saccharovorans TaxID=474960 RepID=A0A1H8CPA8_9FIRM|nr:sugar diacid recognition domain-containing protein [Hydrogenoanaerobacterium saccharovorans]RPF43200.1 carbohydrate diacid regulator [Hydrogenoanaerobacterium saccharovorans]SEM95957.1 carbohydrate diacid regulator [Hydrogenoanaerobacterium saccharovorans]